jgi:hypothetical protein
MAYRPGIICVSEASSTSTKPAISSAAFQHLELSRRADSGSAGRALILPFYLLITCVVMRSSIMLL